MPIPTEPVKRVCYADDLTMWASGVNIPHLKDNSLLISKSLQSRCSPRTHTKPRSILEYSSRIHTCHWFNAQGYWGSIWTPPYHSTSTAGMWQRVLGRNNILEALAGTSWGQQKETLLMTYLQGSRQIDLQLRRTCLESKPT